MNTRQQRLTVSILLTMIVVVTMPIMVHFRIYGGPVEIWAFRTWLLLALVVEGIAIYIGVVRPYGTYEPTTR